VSSLLAIGLLIAGIVLVVAGAELLLDGLVGSAARLGVPAFALTVLVSGFELENLAAGIAANAKNGSRLRRLARKLQQPRGASSGSKRGFRLATRRPQPT
jgi:hypothetical protein